MSRDRLWELLADRATQGLSDLETRELDALLRQYPDVDPDSMDLAAAAVELAYAEKPEPMPAHLRDRIAGVIAGLEQEPRTGTEPIAFVGKRRTPFVLYAGWVAAAACLAFAFGVLWPQLRPAKPLSDQRLALLNKPGTVKGAWGDWDNPEIAGVKGEVVWNEAEQRGFMTFTGLPATDPSKQVYQLWIIDDRGMGQRISGAIFDAQGQGEVIVPIDPQIRTKNAAAFAVTIEEPGGTWVSDMKRRVVIATPKQG